MAWSETSFDESASPLIGGWQPDQTADSFEPLAAPPTPDGFTLGADVSRNWTQPPYADFILNGPCGDLDGDARPRSTGARPWTQRGGAQTVDPDRTVTRGTARPVDFPAPGSEIAGFRLRSVLGQGAFARVYLAEQIDLAGRLVALKVSESQGDEPQALARLQHAHIVPIHSLHDDPDTGLRLLCMPYLGGANLAQVLEIAGEAFHTHPTARSLNTALDALEERGPHVAGSPSRQPNAVSLREMRTGWSRLAFSRHPQAMTRGVGSPSLVRSILARYLARIPSRRGAQPAGQEPNDNPQAAALEIEQPARLYFRAHNYIQASVWIAARLAEALEHAHARGILHRDIKPSNILIAADGTPMLLDFNLSALEGTAIEEGDEPRARVGGTLPYMAPEHLDAFHPKGTTHSAQVDARSDLYSLGLILYEMLGGQHPFPDPDASLPLAKALDAMLAARRAGVPSIRTINVHVPQSLDAILTKCLESNPDARYQSAADLADDLRRYLDDLPLKHVPELSLRERAAKWLRRHPEARSSTTVGAVSLALLIVLGLGGLSIASRLEAASAVFKRNQFTRIFRECQLLLNTTHGPTRHQTRGLDLAERALEAYHLTGPAIPRDWADRPMVRRLPLDEQRSLRYELAELFLLKARALFAQSLLLAETARKDHLEQGLDLLDRAEEVEPRPTYALVMERARFERALGRVHQADANTQRASRIGLVDARDYYLAGTGLAAAGRLDHAEHDLSRSVAMDSRRFWAWFALGLCHYDQGRYREAAADFGVCTVLTPSFAWPYMNRGLALAASGRVGEARAAYDRALELDPDFLEALVNRALACLELDQSEQALSDLNRAIEQGTDSPALLAARAQALARLDRAADAEQQFAEALAANPNDPTQLVARGIFRLQQNDPAAAKRDLDAALEIQPTHPRALLAMAHLNRHANPRAAVDDLDRALQSDPSLLDAVQLRALLRAHLGDPAAEADVDRLVAAPTPLNLYNAACALAILAKSTATERLLDRSATLLQRAFGAGIQPADAARDADLAPLVESPRFAGLFRPAASAESPPQPSTAAPPSSRR